MTHRDGFPRFSARSAWRGDARPRKPRATPPESLGKPPFRSRRRTGSGRPWGRRKALPMSRIARGFPPTRRIACTISMGHYQRFLVLDMAEPTLDRRDVLSRLFPAPEDYLFVGGLAGSARDAAALTGDGDNLFTMAGTMGAAVSMGLGVALSAPEAKVAVITGDGELLMNLGALD